ncbi:protein phosphatase 1F [Microcaecilia unicolor]|uniref:Protein phosphatase 1F n=1 Tax=Microcaecilia unicolor TaxID=1415580 RepID=A0A6P7Z972_9AMPH|nr:protein phosphatase 1F [Microcaecilia unicolor]
MASVSRQKNGCMTEEADGVLHFLDSFLQDFPAPLSPEDPLPQKPQNSILNQDEVLGEMSELAVRLLRDRNASPLLAAALAYASVERLLQADLSDFIKKQNSQEKQEEDETTLLDAAALQRSWWNKLWEVCGAWQKQLPLLNPLKCYLLVSIHAIRNTRRKMEDRHVSLPEFNQFFGLKDGLDRAYFAVFDGHGGLDATNYAATHLHINVGLHEKLMANPAEALRDSFQRTDNMFLKRAKRERLRSGTTGVSALIVGNRLHVAWLGDSQIVLVRQSKALMLMDPHKPDRKDERQRIEALGGCITHMGCWRVNGTLAVSRAIGDIDQKPYISGVADGASFQLMGCEDYLVLACDGFFDSVKTWMVVELVLEHLRENGGDGTKTAESLVTAAKEGGSSDNITVMVVFFRDPRTILADSLTAAGSCRPVEHSDDSLFNFFSSEAEDQGTNHMNLKENHDKID